MKRRIDSIQLDLVKTFYEHTFYYNRSLIDDLSDNEPSMTNQLDDSIRRGVGFSLASKIV